MGDSGTQWDTTAEQPNFPAHNGTQWDTMGHNGTQWDTMGHNGGATTFLAHLFRILVGGNGGNQNPGLQLLSIVEQ